MKLQVPVYSESDMEAVVSVLVAVMRKQPGEDPPGFVDTLANFRDQLPDLYYEVVDRAMAGRASSQD